jgi:hypothetical protein
MTIGNTWRKVVYAEELPDCEGCGDKWCPYHNMHYADCECIGPTQDNVMYKKDSDGVLYARPMTKAERKKYHVAR